MGRHYPSAQFSKPGLTVRLRKGEDVDAAYKRLRKKCERDNLFNDMKKHRYYEKPSERRRKKKLAAIKKRLRKQRNRNKKRKR